MEMDPLKKKVICGLLQITKKLPPKNFSFDPLKKLFLTRKKKNNNLEPPAKILVALKKKNGFDHRQKINMTS